MTLAAERIDPPVEDPIRSPWRRSDRDPWIGPITCVEAHWRVRHRFEGMADRQALHFLALPGTGKQNLRRQGALFANAEIIQPGSCVVATGRHGYRAERYGARRILS